MANKKTANSGTNNETKVTTISANRGDYEYKRERAQTMTFAKMMEILQRNPTRTENKTFTQYTKDLVKTYIQSPSTNQDTLREISRFLCRNSMLYQKMIMYLAAMPLFYYTITQINNLDEDIDQQKALKDYQKVLENFHRFSLKKDMYTALYLAIRDGFYVGFVYDDKQGRTFLMPLDVKYCRIAGKNEYGEWVVYFNASFFDAGNNKEFVEGVDGNEAAATWSDVFVVGYREYKERGRDYQWFRLPPEQTCTLIVGPEDEFAFPLPHFLPLFTDLLDLLDLQQIIQSKAELENYALLINQIPLVDKGNSGDVDDFAISMEMIDYFTQLEENAAPSLVGVVTAPWPVDKLTFKDSANATDTDTLGKSLSALFSNSGLTQTIVSGGNSTSNLAIKLAQLCDQSNVWVWLNRLESWLDFYIRENISKGFIFEFLRITWFNEDDYIQKYKDVATLGGPALDYLSVVEGNPYKAINKIKFENALGIKDIMIPLQSSYNTSSSGQAGRPQIDDDSELSGSAERTRNTGSDIA